MSYQTYFSFSRSSGVLVIAASGVSENMSSIWATTAVKQRRRGDAETG